MVCRARGEEREIASDDYISWFLWVIMIHFFIISIVLCLSFLLTWFLRRYAIKRHLMDMPNSRSSHVVPTPRGGGVAIVFCFLSAIFYCYLIGDVQRPAFNTLFIGGLLVAGIGYWDDHLHIPAKWRILVHFGAAIWALFMIGGFPDLLVGRFVWSPGWLGYGVGIVSLVWLLNLYNFMDGIDGIAGVEAISVAFCAAFILLVTGNAHESFLLMVLAAASLGFLIWNWPPAKIFMGDVGSGFLGFVLGVFALHTAGSGALSLWCWVILLAVFLVDATCTLLRRILRGDRFYEAHRSHAYQYLSLKLQQKNVLKGMLPVMARARGHRFVILCVAGINFFWLFPLAWVVSLRPESGVYLACIAIVPLVVIAIKFGAGKKFV